MKHIIGIIGLAALLLWPCALLAQTITTVSYTHLFFRHAGAV